MNIKRQIVPGHIGIGNNERSGACAFFDVDGTLWNDKSVLSFYKIFLQEMSNGEAEELWSQFLVKARSLEASGVPRDQLNKWFYTRFADVEVSRIASVARLWWKQQSRRPDFWIKETIREVRNHIDEGKDVILVTGSFREIILPLVEFLGATDAFVAPLEEVDGVYTGRLCGLPMISIGKSEAVRNHMARRGINPRRCYAYGDDDSDVPFLELVGNPIAVARTPSRLTEIAHTRNWPILQC